jgi:CRISPR/Cas system-associated protein Cas10 (large subunit of type III CRISPR-Cas system)
LIKPPEEAYIKLFNSLKRSRITNIPAHTAPPINDHSLWDHLKLTSAFTTCICQDGGYRGDELGNYRFALIGGDTDKIGAFVSRSRRLPDLRARSKIASKALKASIDTISRKLGPDCVIYDGGGNFLAISPLNLANELQKLSEEVFEEFTHRELSITITAVETNGVNVKNMFDKVWERVAESVQERKRMKSPPTRPKIEASTPVCDVCRYRPFVWNHEDKRFTIVENGIQRFERLCDVCWDLRWDEYAGGPNIDSYADETTGLVAVLKVDGDDMGDIIKGTAFRTIADKQVSPSRQSFMSRIIYETCEQLKKIIEKEFDGECIYAAGDEVLAIVKASLALSCVKRLADVFAEKMAGKATMSAGIAIVKHDFPVYVALEAMEQLLKNAKDPRRKKASVDFEVFYQIGLTREDIARRLRKLKQGLTHRPYKLGELSHLFKLLDFIDRGIIRMNQASAISMVLSTLPFPENVKDATNLTANLIGRGYIDWETGKFLLNNIENGIICDTYSLSTKVYRRGKSGAS